LSQKQDKVKGLLDVGGEVLGEELEKDDKEGCLGGSGRVLGVQRLWFAR
jgi:hypothetical protein